MMMFMLGFQRGVMIPCSVVLVSQHPVACVESAVDTQSVTGQ